MAQQYEDDFETNSSSSGKKGPPAVPSTAAASQQAPPPSQLYAPAAMSVPIPYSPSTQGSIPYSGGGGGAPPPLGYTQPNAAQSYLQLPQGAGPLSSFAPLGYTPWVPPSAQTQPLQHYQQYVSAYPAQVSSTATATTTGGSVAGAGPQPSQTSAATVPPPLHQPWNPTVPAIATVTPSYTSVPSAGVSTLFPPPLGAAPTTTAMPTYPGIQPTLVPPPLQQPSAVANVLPVTTTTIPLAAPQVAVPTTMQAVSHSVTAPAAETTCAIPQLASEASAAAGPSVTSPPPPSGPVASTALPSTAASLRMFVCSGDPHAALTHFTFAGVEMRRRAATGRSPKRDCRVATAPAAKSSSKCAHGPKSPARKSFVSSELRIWRAFRDPLVVPATQPAAAPGTAATTVADPSGAGSQPQSTALVVVKPGSSAPAVDLHSVARTYDDQHGGLSAAFFSGDLFSIAYCGTPDQIEKYIADFKESLPSHLTAEEKSDRLQRLLDSEGHVSYHKRLLGIKKVRAQSTLGLGCKATALHFAVVAGRLDNVLTLAKLKCGRKNIDTAKALAKQNGFSAIAALLDEVRPQKRKHVMTTNTSTKDKSVVSAADP